MITYLQKIQTGKPHESVRNASYLDKSRIHANPEAWKMPFIIIDLETESQAFVAGCKNTRQKLEAQDWRRIPSKLCASRTALHWQVANAR